jgi:nitronate monooxygenase
MQCDLTFGGRVKVPLIVAPMFLVSSPAMTVAACSRGVIGSFPAHSTRSSEVLEQWMNQVEDELGSMRSKGIVPAPYAVNLVVNKTNPRYEGDLELCIKHKVEIVLTSKGAPSDVFEKIHQYGGVAFHDVASKRHAAKAIEAGADGLIAVCSGAGGHTGQMNPFSLVNEIREITDKPIILSGGLTTGRDIFAAQVMGANMAYMGTRFLATHEAISPVEYQRMVVDCEAKDIFYTAALDGYPINILVPSLSNTDITLDQVKAMRSDQKLGAHQVKERFKSIWSAGHGVGMVNKQSSTAEVCDELIEQYREASHARDRFSPSAGRS